MEEAATRRTSEELGARCTPRFLYKFRYQARFGAAGSENEFCWVYSSLYDGDVVADPAEVAQIRYVEPEKLTAELAADGEAFTPWFKLEWKRITEDYLPGILSAAD